MYNLSLLPCGCQAPIPWGWSVKPRSQGMNLCGVYKEAGLGMQHVPKEAGKTRWVVCTGLAAVPPTGGSESGTSVLLCSEAQATLCDLELRATPVLDNGIPVRTRDKWEPYEPSLTLWQAQGLQM